MSHLSSRGYIFPWKHAGFNSEKVSQNRGTLGSDKKLAYNKVCRNTYNYLLLSTGSTMEIIAS